MTDKTATTHLVIIFLLTAVGNLIADEVTNVLNHHRVLLQVSGCVQSKSLQSYHIIIIIIIIIKNNERISRAPFHVKHAQLR